MLDRLRSIKKAAGNALKSDIAKKAGEIAGEIKDKAAEKGHKLIDRGLQDKDLLEKTNAIHRECDRLATAHNTRMQTMSISFEQELDIFRSTLYKADNELLPICQRFFEFSTAALQMRNNAQSRISIDQYGLTYMNNAYADGTID